jgi:beta-glucosidase
MARTATKFPKRFLWGAASAAHQVEGNQHNQWTVWELENAKALAMQAEYHYGDLASWPQAKKYATLPANYISGPATKHYDLYETDFRLLKDMNMNAFRFSVEWSRVEPKEGVWDSEAIAHYRRYVEKLAQMGIEPVITLFHFTLPVWFTDKGGFEKRSNIMYFVRFATKIMEEIGGSIRYVITINEPESYAFEGYYTGNWPPNRRSLRQALKVYRNLAVAHNRVADVLHRKNRRYKIAAAKFCTYAYPGDDALLTRLSARIGQWFADDYWLRKVRRKSDWIGVNYYYSARFYGYRVHEPEQKINDMGTPMEPANIEYELERLWKKYHKPLMITENGLADGDDSDRKWWLMETIKGMQNAMGEGVALFGYLHWSLTDNFEWNKGRWPRFGLAAINYATQERTLRPSAQWFGRVIKMLRQA